MPTARPARPLVPRPTGTPPDTSTPTPESRPFALRHSRLLRGVLAALTATAGCLLTVAPAHADPVIGEVVLDSPATATVGDEIPLSVSAAGLEDLYSYELTLSYDPDHVTVMPAEHPGVPGGFSDSVSDADAGVVVIRATRLGTSPGLEGTQVLTDATVTALAPGETTLTVSKLTGIDSEGVAVDLHDLDAVALTIAGTPGGNPTPTPTPTPTSTTPSASPGAGTGGTPTSSAAPNAQGQGSPLARTGASMTPVLALATGVALVGAGALALARRRADGRDAR